MLPTLKSLSVQLQPYNSTYELVNQLFEVVRAIEGNHDLLRGERFYVATGDCLPPHIVVELERRHA